MDDPPMTLLTATSLTKRYAGAVTNAVAGVSFALAEGKLSVLVGESGCGKTTLLRLIAGLIAPTSGTLHLRDHLLCEARHSVPPEQRQIGLVFQDYALFPHLTVQQNIQFGLHQISKNQKQERGDHLLNLVNLQGLGERYPHELSGGQQQRVAIARALAPEPAMLLLDEPFSNLDRTIRTQVHTELRAVLKQTQTTPLLVTHDTHDALALADHLLVMRNGELIQTGSPREIYTQPVNAYVAQFFGPANLLPATATATGYETPLGLLPHPNPNPALQTLCLRPEDVEMVSSESASCQGTVTHCFFAGHHQEVHLQIPDLPTPLLVTTSTTTRFTIGETVSLRPRPNAAWPLAD